MFSGERLQIKGKKSPFSLAIAILILGYREACVLRSPLNLHAERQHLEVSYTPKTYPRNLFHLLLYKYGFVRTPCF